ncbi:MAG: peptide-methionine (S)-S-oxide reductase [Myxococcota bacterium]|jgi:peptide-methionine (S)-S-oxide reductase
MKLLCSLFFAALIASCSTTQNSVMTTTEEATFAAGCFWGVESVFMATEGVLSTEVGYIGGDVATGTYKEVCSGTTGHAEAVHITFDPQVVSYQRLLEIFFSNHDATQLNRQGPDVGTQYRTAIFVHGADQRTLAEQSISALDASQKLPRPVATSIEAAAEFVRAEEYHQQYNLKNNVSCQIQ